MNVERRPFGAELGIMGWPYAGPFGGHGRSIWKDLLLDAGWTPNLALDDDLRSWASAWEDELRSTKADVLSAMEQAFPITHKWAVSIDWLQQCGRGDVVGIMSLHTGRVIGHACIAWRDEWRDSTGALWNWQFVVASTLTDGKRAALMETRADASGAIVDRRGNPTAKVLVRPGATHEEVVRIQAEWFAAMGEFFRETPPIQTHPVVLGAIVDEEAFAEECRKAAEPLP